MRSNDEVIADLKVIAEKFNIPSQFQAPMKLPTEDIRHKVIYIAMTQAGIKEITGKEDNPEVLKYFNEIGYDGAKLKDETSWCSAFINWVMKQAGQQRTGLLTARSWLEWGKHTNNPQTGDLVVFWRNSPTSWQGHVGLYLRQDSQYIYVLGGNQGNQVSIAPYHKIRVLAFRTYPEDTMHEFLEQYHDKSLDT